MAHGRIATEILGTRLDEMLSTSGWDVLTILGNLEADASGLVIRKEDDDKSFDYGPLPRTHAPRWVLRYSLSPTSSPALSLLCLSQVSSWIWSLGLLTSRERFQGAWLRVPVSG